MTEENASLKDKVSARVTAIRRTYPFIDHVLRMLTHYGKVKGNVLSGAVTYFGLLSFFPILALAFAIIGYVSTVYGGAEEALVDAINAVFPHMVGDKPGEIPLSTFTDNASAVGIIGLAGVLYSGLGWLSGMRSALLLMFEKPVGERPNFIVGKARDLVVLALVGLILIVSVAVTGAVTSLASSIIDWLPFTIPGAQWLLWVLGHLLGIAATMLLFLAMFRFLANPDLPRRGLLGGALLGAVGFEILKSLASFLISLTQGQPAFQAFGIALILLVWINYFSRVTMYGAAWAVTAVVPQPAVEPAPDTTADEDALDGMGGRFDLGSAVFGSLAAGAVAAVVYLRDRAQGPGD